MRLHEVYIKEAPYLDKNFIPIDKMITYLEKAMEEKHHPDWLGWVRQNKVFKLKTIPINSVAPADGWEPTPGKIEDMAKSDLSNAPLIVVHKDGTMIDGNHRHQALKKQGAQTVKAYIGESNLQEGPVSRAIGTALLGLGLMGSPNADAGPDSAAYKAGYDGVQSVLSMPGKLLKKVTATDFKPFDIRNDKPSKSDPAYQKVAYATCQTIASMVDKDLTPRLVQKGETFYDIKSDTPSEQAPRFTLKDNGKGKGSCVFQYTTYKTAYTGTPFDPKIFQTRQIQMVWNDYVITDVQYIANPKGTQPSVGLVTDPSDRSQALNLHKNEDKRVAPKQVKDITNYALAGATINLKVLTDNYDKK